MLHLNQSGFENLTRNCWKAINGQIQKKKLYLYIYYEAGTTLVTEGIGQRTEARIQKTPKRYLKKKCREDWNFYFFAILGICMSDYDKLSREDMVIMCQTL